MANFINGIISLSISVVVLANVFIFVVKNTSQCYGNCSAGANGTAWTAPEVAMWSLLTLVGIVGLVYGVMSVFGIM